MAVVIVEPHEHISLPSGWGATGATAPADDADANTVSPSNYLNAHGNHRIGYHDADMAAKSDIALADVIAFSVEAGGLYAFEFYVNFVVAAATTGISLAMNGPTIGTGWISFGANATISLAAAGGGSLYAYESKITTAGSLVAGSNAVVGGMLQNGATAGNLALRYSPEVAASLTIKRGTWGRIIKLN